jgi:GTP-binding protein HflX
VLLSDTVGFIRNLPTTVVKAFRATLEEVADAALILHVVDASAASAREHTAHVAAVLAEIGAAGIPQILVLNKIDRIVADEGEVEALKQRLIAGQANTRAVSISAVTGAGMDGLLAAMDETLPLDRLVHATFRVPAGDGATLALLHEFARVLATRYFGDVCEVEAEIPESLQRRLPAPVERPPVEPPMEPRP